VAVGGGSESSEERAQLLTRPFRQLPTPAVHQADEQLQPLSGCHLPVLLSGQAGGRVAVLW
jgi:hypothetical protein